MPVAVHQHREKIGHYHTHSHSGVFTAKKPRQAAETRILLDKVVSITPAQQRELHTPASSSRLPCEKGKFIFSLLAIGAIGATAVVAVYENMPARVNIPVDNSRVINSSHLEQGALYFYDDGKAVLIPKARFPGFILPHEEAAAEIKAPHRALK